MLLPTAAELSCQGMTSWHTRHAKSHLPIHQGAAAGAYFILVVRSLQSAPRRTLPHQVLFVQPAVCTMCVARAELGLLYTSDSFKSSLRGFKVSKPDNAEITVV